MVLAKGGRGKRKEGGEVVKPTERNKRLEKNIMAAFKALKKERKLSKLPWLILSQLSKHIQKSHAKPTTHRNSHGQKSISNPPQAPPERASMLIAE
ncbi:hypothetical protein SO802_026810 [Lithocarpus litseifolius]|uniref:Uncharacterized protein n=1 Tax=Lithocarpus litseifolius TaxID=425828 RepID=A0AAW2C438_9ROSI